MTTTDTHPDNNAIVVQPMQWNGVPDLDEVKPLSEDDYPCLKEVRDVLARHGKLDRFGVTLIHSHFAIGPDESLVELADAGTRTLTIRPMKNAAMAGKVIETQWRLSDIGPLVSCFQGCFWNEGTHHWQHQYRYP